MDCSSSHTSIFSSSVREAFAQYIQQFPNNRRISQAEATTIIEWLTTRDASKPSSQQESSRRHYIRKHFVWDSTEARLCALVRGKEAEAKKEVVTQDRIADMVEAIHVGNGHGGWDATWNDTTNSYYGILRADVIFLVKQCIICAQDPRKRPKSTPASSQARANPVVDHVSEAEIVHLRDCIWDEFLHESPVEPEGADSGGKEARPVSSQVGK